MQTQHFKYWDHGHVRPPAMFLHNFLPIILCLFVKSTILVHIRLIFTLNQRTTVICTYFNLQHAWSDSSPLIQQQFYVYTVEWFFRHVRCIWTVNAWSVYLNSECMTLSPFVIDLCVHLLKQQVHFNIMSIIQHAKADVFPSVTSMRMIEWYAWCRLLCWWCFPRRGQWLPQQHTMPIQWENPARKIHDLQDTTCRNYTSSQVGKMEHHEPILLNGITSVNTFQSAAINTSVKLNVSGQVY